MTWLLDGNVLVAAAINSHPLHSRAKKWMETTKETFHTCSVTEGTFIRLHMQIAIDRSAAAAWQALCKYHADSMHDYLDDGFSYQQVNHQGLLGHKQVTDAWLAELARRHGAKLATLDAGLVAMHPDVGFLLP